MTNSTTSDILLENATKYANMPALSSKDKSGNWNTTTWAEFSGETMAVAKSLTALGFQKGDKLSIYSVYFPSGSSGEIRQNYKMWFLKKFTKFEFCSRDRL